jgi:hypothetical protein
VSGRTARANVGDGLKITFNGSASSYTGRSLAGNGSTAFSETNTDSTGGSAYLYGGQIDGASATSSTFGNLEIYIPNYAGSANKSLSIDGVMENNATDARSALVAGLWSNTDAITSIKLESFTSNNFVQYSTASLYGIKKD